MPRLFVITALVVLTAGRAAADPPAPPPKQTETAWLVSGVTTAAGIVLLAAGQAAYRQNARGVGDAMLLPGLAAMIVGPTTGHWYAHRLGTIGLGIRAATLGTMIVAFWRCGDCSPEVRTGILLVGGVAWTGGAIVDFALLGSSVRAYNARVTLAPIVSADHRGLALVGRW